MDLDGGAIERNVINLNVDHITLLQLVEHRIKHTALGPAVGPSVNRAPRTELLWQAAPLTAVLGNIPDAFSTLRFDSFTLPR